jgi:hypothetical protein
MKDITNWFKKMCAYLVQLDARHALKMKIMVMLLAVNVLIINIIFMN